MANQTDVFAVDNDGQLQVTRVVGSPGWTGPKLLGPPGRLFPAAAVAVSTSHGFLCPRRRAGFVAIISFGACSSCSQRVPMPSVSGGGCDFNGDTAAWTIGKRARNGIIAPGVRALPRPHLRQI